MDWKEIPTNWKGDKKDLTYRWMCALRKSYYYALYGSKPCGFSLSRVVMNDSLKKEMSELKSEISRCLDRMAIITLGRDSCCGERIPTHKIIERNHKEDLQKLKEHLLVCKTKAHSLEDTDSNWKNEEVERWFITALELLDKEQ
jgi:hypothetical protein